MKVLSYLFLFGGLLLCLYGVIGRFVGSGTLGFLGILPTMKVTAVITIANTLLLISIIFLLHNKK